MGFEQLAALRDELAARAAQARQTSKTGSNPRKSPSSGGQPRPAAGSRPTPADSPGKPAGGERSPQAAPGRRRDADARRQNGRPAPAQEGAKSRTRRNAAAQVDIDPVLLAISRLQRHFPATFPKKPADKVPLKLGIHKDLYERKEALGLPEDQIKQAIATWCRGSRYWACLVQGAERLDLDGQPAGAVTESDETRARQLAGRRQAQANKARRQKASAAAGDAPATTDAATPDQPPITPAADDTVVQTAPEAPAVPPPSHPETSPAPTASPAEESDTH